ncbi:MAG: hypothetical protein RJB01_1697 [Actinomycetota bacterium]|jgi:probable phosphomutase (TIGR03848 family)
MATVLLIRHGRTSANAAGLLAGWSPGVFLDEVGLAQVRALAAQLSEIALKGIVSSPLDRTLETSEELARSLEAEGKDVPIKVDERIGECHYGDWTGKALSELSEHELWPAVQAHPASVRFPGGESLLDMQHRAVACIRDFNEQFGPEATYAVVSHGDVIKAILADALGMHLDHFQRIQVSPASVSVVRYTTARPFVAAINTSAQGLGSSIGVSSSSDATVGGESE